MLNAAGFDDLARAYRRETGFALAAVDPDGRMLRGAAALPACARREKCRPFRAQAVAEALRWGEPCVLCCDCGRALWAVPVSVNQQLGGGLLVAGVTLRRPARAGSLDRRILGACQHLLTLAVERNLANAALLADRRSFARREQEKAEALHTLKDRLGGMLEQLIDAIQANPKRPNSMQLARALDYVEEHLADDLSRDTVARAAGLAPSYFSHLMRARTGWSFTELLTRLRVDHACHLLAHTELDLVEIALACGFGDQSYLSRVFRKRTGRTPGAYRQHYRRRFPGDSAAAGVPPASGIRRASA